MIFLITGGAGFIGSHVCERLLREGHSVWAFDDLNNFYAPELKQRNLHDLQALAKSFEFVQGDLTDRAAVEELFSSVTFDQVIHLAARAGVRPSLQDPALPTRQRGRHGQPARSRAFPWSQESHHCFVVLRLWNQLKGALFRKRSHLRANFALRGQQACLRGVRPRIPPRLRI